MAAKSRDKSAAEILEGLDTLVEAGKVGEVEEVLTTLIESESAEEPSEEEERTRTYAEGMRDGIALARAAAGDDSGS